MQYLIDEDLSTEVAIIARGLGVTSRWRTSATSCSRPSSRV